MPSLFVVLPKKRHDLLKGREHCSLLLVRPRSCEIVLRSLFLTFLPFLGQLFPLLIIIIRLCLLGAGVVTLERKGRGLPNQRRRRRGLEVFQNTGRPMLCLLPWHSCAGNYKLFSFFIFNQLSQVVELLSIFVTFQLLQNTVHVLWVESSLRCGGSKKPVKHPFPVILSLAREEVADQAVPWKHEHPAKLNISDKDQHQKNIQ